MAAQIVPAVPLPKQEHKADLSHHTMILSRSNHLATAAIAVQGEARGSCAQSGTGMPAAGSTGPYLAQFLHEIQHLRGGFLRSRANGGRVGGQRPKAEVPLTVWDLGATAGQARQLLSPCAARSACHRHRTEQECASTWCRRGCGNAWYENDSRANDKRRSAMCFVCLKGGGNGQGMQVISLHSLAMAFVTQRTWAAQETTL